MWLIAVVLALSLTLPVSGAPFRPQETTPPPSEENAYEFFSGTVVDFSDAKVTISRSVLGRAPESRDFLINAETKVEGKLKNKVRVTVGFKSSPDGDVAVRIIVRSKN